MFTARVERSSQTSTDGDLDLLLVGGPKIVVYRNNLDGTFTDVAEVWVSPTAPWRTMQRSATSTMTAASIVMATDNGVALYHNTTTRQFEDATASSGLPATGAWTSVTVADYDNDGTLDLFSPAATGAGAVAQRRSRVHARRSLSSGVRQRGTGVRICTPTSWTSTTTAGSTSYWSGRLAPESVAAICSATTVARSATRRNCCLRR
jgi:hypothetical protein